RFPFGSRQLRPVFRWGVEVWDLHARPDDRRDGHLDERREDRAIRVRRRPTVEPQCPPPELPPRMQGGAREAERVAAACYCFGCVIGVGAAGVVAGVGAVAGGSWG